MITVVYGSARKNGNTDMLADAFIKGTGLKEDSIKRFYLRNMKLQPCTACGGCDTTGICIYDDQIWSIFREMDKSDFLLIASPITFASVTAQAKAYIDRGQAFWVRKFVLGLNPPIIQSENQGTPKSKKGFFISVGGMNTQKYFQNAKMVVQTFMVSTGFKYSGELFFPGVDKKGEIAEKPDAIAAAETAGRDFINI